MELCQVPRSFRIFVFIFISDDKNVFISNSTIDIGRDWELSSQLLGLLRPADCTNAT